MMRRGRLLPAALAGALAVAGCHDDRHDERLRAAGPNPSLDALLNVADVASGAAKFGQCQACHTVVPDALDKEGPNLFGVYGQPIGHHRPNYPYTADLRRTPGRWDAPTLNRWLAGPQQMVPGTKMQVAGVADPLDRADIIAYLRSLSQ